MMYCAMMMALVRIEAMKPASSTRLPFNCRTVVMSLFVCREGRKEGRKRNDEQMLLPEQQKKKKKKSRFHNIHQTLPKNRAD
jgi:hypothetical protein